MANLAAASRPLPFERVLGRLPLELKEKLEAVGLTRCATWAYLKPFEVPLADFDNFDKIRDKAADELLRELGVISADLISFEARGAVASE